MTIVISDAALLAQLAEVQARVEMQDPNGNYLGTFTPYGKLPPGVKSPHTIEEIEELRRQKGGRPLADILRDLEKRG